MKVAISNIAWDEREEPEVAARLQALGVRGVEVAPGRIGARPAELPDDAIRRYRDGWNARGIEVCAMQALLFGAPDLVLFGSQAQRDALRDHLARIVRLGGLLGARALVFGSPRNRRVGALDRAEAGRIAVAFFRDLGAVARDHGTRLVVEPNPPQYGADWITNAREARELVAAVAHEGFGLHLDAGALHLAGEGARGILDADGLIRHFHASQPELAPLAAGGEVAHHELAQALRDVGYAHWVSVEMRRPQDRPVVAAVETALAFALEVYGR